jgi:hypothetical protein
LENIVRSYPDFINYVQIGLKKLIQKLIGVKGVGMIYRIINHMSFVRPETMEVIVDTVHKESPAFALTSYAVAVKENENGCLTSKNALKTLINYYTFEKVDKAFAKKGVILTKFLN